MVNGSSAMASVFAISCCGGHEDFTTKNTKGFRDMRLTQFAEEYSELPPSEQSQFAETVRRLLSDGLVWREDEGDERTYSFLLRRSALVGDYLSVAGWELRHEERLRIFQIVHRDGSHRR